MSLLNSLFSGVSGLRNHQVMMDVIGDNISNVNSLGYKGSRVTFSDTFSQFMRYGTNPTETSGGTNTFQVGLGAKVNAIDRNWNQGTFERTNINTDLALQGSGMFVLEKNGQKFYSRAGNFIFDANGSLVNSQTGALVQGKLASADGIIPPGTNLGSIKIDPSMKIPAKATTSIKWGGNLSSTSTKTSSDVFLQTGNLKSSTTAADPAITDANTIYDDNGNAYTLSTSYTRNAGNPNQFDLSWKLVAQSDPQTTIKSGTSTLTFDATTGALTAATNTTPDPNDLTKIQINVNDTTSKINFNLNLTKVTSTATSSTVSSTVDANRTPTIINGTLTIYDSLGNSHTLTIKYTKTSNNNWNWNASVPATSGTLANTAGTITFNPDGSIQSMNPSSPVVNFTPTGGAAAQNIALDFGTAFGGITQTNAGSVVSPQSQNGVASASLMNMNVDQYGVIVGVFSNGESRNLAQLLVANFNNLNGLVNAGDNMYSVSANSGEPVYGVPGESTRTTVQAGALEQSNVDLSEEFAKMIVSQRGFQANARVITTADSLLQEITNLVR